jgi:hypothetical protein
MTKKVFYIITGNTPGLRADAAVVVSALKNNFDCQIIISRERNAHRVDKRWLLMIRSIFSKSEVIGIFLENIPKPWSNVFKRFILIPNQEWIRPETKSSMRKCEQIWCKTRYAEKLLSADKFNTKYIGFTSKNIYRQDVEKNYNEFLHVPGRSTLKGTEKVFEAWLKHPEWPHLTVITKNLNHVKYQCNNIKIITDFLSEEVLSRLMNSIALHICTSETEGFGHYLNEACAARALVVTTDAPPMNELINSNAGFLIKYDSVISQGISERFFIDSQDFENTIVKIINMSVDEKIKYGSVSGSSYLERDLFFNKKINELAQNLLN